VSIRNSPAFDELDHTAALRIITYHPEDGLGPPPTERAIGVACHGHASDPLQSSMPRGRLALPPASRDASSNSDDLICLHISDHHSRITRHHDSIRYIARDDGTGSD
jgi:hypothetical protein